MACKLGSIGPLDARDNDATGLNFTPSLRVAPAHEGGAVRAAVGIRTAGYTDEDVHYLYESALPVQAVVPMEERALRCEWCRCSACRPRGQRQHLRGGTSRVPRDDAAARRDGM